MATIRDTFTIEEEVLKKLKSYSKKTMIPKSRIISKLLEEFFEKPENSVVYSVFKSE